jgi:FkbM family methyltransferase
MASIALEKTIATAAKKFGFLPGYEAEQFKALAGLLEGARRFVDIGANRGMYAWVANEICKDAEIVLVEADPELGKALGEEVATWQGRNRLVTVPCAAGDVEGELSFQVGSEDTVGSFVDTDYSAASTVSVAVRPLDALVEPGPRTVFKLDVEGFEYRVLTGARAHLSQPDCKLIIELHGWGDRQINAYPFDVVMLLYHLGYAPRLCSGAHYVFEKKSWPVRTGLLLRYGPLVFAKSTIRRLGLRDQVYGVLSKLGILDKSNATSGLDQR